MAEPTLPRITLNGGAHTLPTGGTVTDLVQELTGCRLGSDGQAADGKRLGVAVVRNAAVVPRSQWAATTLISGDDVEIVTAAQGG
jgi:sulfur carrier protein